MDTFEFNKIAGAVLFTLLLVLGLGFLAEVLYTPPALQQQAYVVEVPEEGEAAAGHGAEPEEEPLPVLLAAADPDKGQSAAKKCAACHGFEEGESKPTGPNLHGVVGRVMASADFAYSDALREMGASGETWTYEKLFGFLEAPKKYIDGTKMGFAGLKKASDRANVITYLRTISPDAPPLPEPEPAAAEQASTEPGVAAGEEPEATPAEPASPGGEPAATSAEPASPGGEPAAAPDGPAAPAGEAPATPSDPADAQPSEPAAGDSGATSGQ